MSTQDMRKLATVVRSIELIEEKTNILHAQYNSDTNENDKRQKTRIDDSNIHLQLFFQHLEQLLQMDLKTGLFSNNANKRNYWNFFSLALKESKGLYDAVSYVLNSQEVKTPVGRGRLFLRFCLESHRLGDVIQQSFMMTKIVNQFYVDENFWTTPTYINRIIQALYQLNELQFNLLSTSQYQLDICWPAFEGTTDSRLKEIAQDPTRARNESSSSLISMNSVDSQSIVSVAQDASESVSIQPIPVPNLEFSFNGASSAPSATSADEDPENSVAFWKEKCLQLENQLLEIQLAPSTQSTEDAEIQCSLLDPMEHQSLMDENEKAKKEIESLNERNEQLQNETEELNKNKEQLTSETTTLNGKNEQLNTQLSVLQEEVNNLNFQLSSVAMQRSTNADKIKDYERELAQYQTNHATKEALINQLQEKLNQQSNELKTLEEKYHENFNKQKQRLESLEIELENGTKLLEDERKVMTRERQELTKAKEQLEAALQEKTLDFEEMKRRLVKAVREKAELFNSIHSYEMKLEQEQSKKWVADEDVDNCTKCNISFGWTVRRHHCRHCQKIFCNHCSNNWIQSTKTNTPQYRICDFCNEKGTRDITSPNDKNRSTFYYNHAPEEDVDLSFEVRPERLSGTIDTQSKP